MSKTPWNWGRGLGKQKSPLADPATARYPARRGIFGGTFDPPHIGHLVLAEAARSELGLSEVVFMPAAQPPHKLDKVVSPTHHRVEMVKRAIATNGRFALSTLDADREGPSYTVESMTMLREEWGNTVEIVFIMGLDSLVDLPTWYKAPDLLKLVNFAVVARPGYHADMASLERQLPGVVDRVTFVPAPLIGVSSTVIRQRVQESDSIRYLVPPSVERYIYEAGLYQTN
jgi:nicotinate-nucleotide adenylyltransferase